jgi:hypothetical protein
MELNQPRTMAAAPARASAEHQTTLSIFFAALCLAALCALRLPSERATPGR